MKCPKCGGKGYAFVRTTPNPITGYGYNRTCDECCGKGEVDEYKLRLDFQKCFPENVRNSREFYIRTCQTEKLVDIIYNLIRWDIPVPGIFLDNTDAENKKAVEIWLREEHKE